MVKTVRAKKPVVRPGLRFLLVPEPVVLRTKANITHPMASSVVAAANMVEPISLLARFRSMSILAITGKGGYGKGCICDDGKESQGLPTGRHISGKRITDKEPMN